jgi:hypothetical protein
MKSRMAEEVIPCFSGVLRGSGPGFWSAARLTEQKHRISAAEMCGLMTEIISHAIGVGPRRGPTPI